VRALLLVTVPSAGLSRSGTAGDKVSTVVRGIDIVFPNDIIRPYHTGGV
jgi:hypothetical protein